MRRFWPLVMVLLGCLAGTAARAQDLDAGKTGPQLFAQDCVSCHRSPQGLAKRLSGSSLVSFLREHYTSSAASANAVAGYLLANVGNPRAERPKARPGEDQAKPAAGQAGERSKVARPTEQTATP